MTMEGAPHPATAHQSDAAAPTQEGQEPFPLASALFGFAPATDNASPAKQQQEQVSDEQPPGSDEQPPGAWLQVFISEHADAGVFSGLIPSCKSGRRWVLQTAPSARLTLDYSKHQLSMAEVHAALRERGPRPLSLVIECRVASPRTYEARSQSMLACLASLPEQLAATDSGITDIRLSVPSLDMPTPLSTFLHSLGPHLPHLTTLHLDTCVCALPPPSHLPTLTHLSLWSKGANWPDVSTAAPAVYASVAAYMPQLIHLGCHISEEWPKPWAALLNPATTAYKLTSLDTPLRLTDTLLRLLMQCAPALKRLSVFGIVGLAEGFTDMQWGVEHLTVQFWFQLPFLPRPAVGPLKVTVENGCRLPVLSDEGLEARMLPHMGNWVLDTERINIPCQLSVPAAAQPAALRAALEQLGRLQAPGARVLLGHNWQWTEVPGLTQIVADALPALTHLNFGVWVETLTDELLTAILHMGPRIRSLAWRELALQSDHSADAVWPWDEVGFDSKTVNVWGLVKLPSPVGRATKPVVRTGSVALGSNVPQDEESIQRMEQFLSHVDFHDLPVSNGPSLRLNCTVTPLTTQLRLLPLVHYITPGANRKTGVTLKHLRVDKEAIAALAALPVFGGSLHFEKCEWPLQPSEYVTLGHTISPSYSMWHTALSGTTREIEACMFRGALERRRGLGLPPLFVCSHPDHYCIGQVEMQDGEVVVVPS